MLNRQAGCRPCDRKCGLKQDTWTGCLAEEHDDFYISKISRPYCPTTSSSVVERGTVDPQVAGSIPAWWTCWPDGWFDSCLDGLVDLLAGWLIVGISNFPPFFSKFPAIFHLSTPSPLFPPFRPCPLAPFLAPSFLHLGPFRPIVSTAFRHLGRHYSSTLSSNRGSAAAPLRHYHSGPFGDLMAPDIGTTDKIYVYAMNALFGYSAVISLSFHGTYSFLYNAQIVRAFISFCTSPIKFCAATAEPQH